MRTLYVKRTSTEELKSKGWPSVTFNLNNVFSNQCYIQCNKKGQVKWDKASVYHSEELIERNNVKIVK